MATPSPTSTATPIPLPSQAEQRAVLTAFYYATNGDNWTNNDDWLTVHPFNSWYGVRVDAHGRITYLDLSRNNLNGTLIPEIGHLTELRFLNLDHNDIIGRIPEEIAELDKLWYLGLANNEISGPIPAAIGKMTSLKQLDLSGNDLSGAIPPELAHLTNLSELSLHSNKLEGPFPRWVGGLHRLQRLTLADNQLTGEVSMSLNDLEGLSTLSIAGNNLSGCLPEILRDFEPPDFLFSNYYYCDEPPKQQPFAPAFFKWAVGDAVVAREERAARLGVQWLFEYAESVGWPIVGDDITVYFMTLEPLLDAYAKVVGGEIESHRELLSSKLGVALSDANFTRATEVGESINRSRLFRRAETIIHENIHVAFQYDIMGLYTVPSLARQQSKGPAWFTEGMASYFDALITSIHSGETDFRCRDCEPRMGGVTASEIPLSAAEHSNTCEYVCGALAIELLASIVGQRHIVDFYTLRRPGRTWQETFEEVFGISVQDFYALYDQHRTAGFPELNPTITPATESSNDTRGEQLPDDRHDRAALITFYNSTRGDSWDNKTNWLSEEPLATWYGVSVDSSGRVQGISLSENRLRGTIPREIGDLTNLKWLFLNGNQIRGAIPNNITQLNDLEDLWLGENQLGGSIPDDIGHMTNLRYLALDYNEISGRLPASMMSMDKLRYLNLEGNDLAGPIPSNLGDLKSLEVIKLNENQLTGFLPDSIGRLSKLRELEARGNRLSGIIPASLGNLTKLESLNLCSNRLSGNLPATLGNMTNMKFLNLCNNSLTGIIPEKFSKMSSLVVFFLNGNRLSGQFPAWLANIEQIRNISLAGNPLTGCIPPELFDISYHDLDKIPLPKCN